MKQNNHQASIYFQIHCSSASFVESDSVWTVKDICSLDIKATAEGKIL